MANLSIHASPQFLNELDWQLRRLSLLELLHNPLPFALSVGSCPELGEGKGPKSKGCLGYPSTSLLRSYAQDERRWVLPI